MNVLQPVVGKVTFEAEGAEGGPFHSRVLHVPSPSSGLTIGRGYDMKHKNKIKVRSGLRLAGLAQKDADLLSKAAGLSGMAAENFIATHKLEKFEITQKMQVDLFNISYKEEESEARRLCSKPDVEAKFGKCDWSSLDSAIKQILVDLKFRGDYTSDARNLIQKYVVTNDTAGFLSVLSDKSKWTTFFVPNDRFQRRVNFFKANAVFKP